MSAIHFGVLLVGFLTPDRFHIFGVSEDDLTGRFQGVANGNPVFTCGFHTDIGAVVFSKPGCTTAQIAGKGGEPFLLVCSYASYRAGVQLALAICVNNFKRSTSPQNNILRKQAGTGHSPKD